MTLFLVFLYSFFIIFYFASSLRSVLINLFIPSSVSLFCFVSSLFFLC
jgi:hypothetical protein